MAVYERETRVRAPFEEVWAFHADPAGLEVLTPDWMGLRIESVTGPDGEAGPEALTVGSRLAMSLEPVPGVRRSWVSEIVARENDGDNAYFRDVMEDGPFRKWEHTHLFYRDGSATVLRDRLVYETPVRAFDPFAKVGFAGMFRQRHKRTRELLEGQR